ncbi:ATP-binding cassette domain-containing protein [Azoarcus sp. TTM-91]|uniref:ABC transporter ATP-binding protein n=1 Tax=Azoarcus sp. TTM-91 TaxID=2691581 RepID=UPI00145DF9A8|nr:ABC transporter ATP-binding protein [Azoarcus sp. TTM-91]NMG33668.1 ATP-binding cassette domain-containing protein [Azoarcus sp. TTM-91]
MLEISRLSKRRPGDTERSLFSGLELRIAAGECVAVVGESGSGKSTLLNCLAGLEPVDGGELRLGGTTLTGLDDDAYARVRRERFGFVFQAFHILPHLTLAQNVALPLWLLQRPAAQAEREALAMLERVGLRDRADDWPAGLSGGEQQRVAIARALVHNPQLVLADEPTGNLDPARADDVLDLLLARIRDSGAAGILVTHSHRAAARCDRILRLSESGLLPADEG